MATHWDTPGITERVAELWTRERETSTKIVKILATEFSVSVSRQAVLRKIARLGLNGQGNKMSAAQRQQFAPAAISLPSVCGSYVYESGRLVRDGVVVSQRTAQ